MGLNPQALAKLGQAGSKVPQKKWNREDLPIRQQHQLGQQEQGIDNSMTGGKNEFGVDKKEQAMLAVRGAAGDPTAIAELAKQKMEEVQKRLESASGHVASAFKTESGAGAVGQGLRATGDIAGMLPGGEMTEPILKFGAAIAELPDKIKEFANGLHEANKRFADYSGLMTHVMVQQEMRDAILSQQRGDRRAESAGKLAEAKNRLDVATAPLDDKWAEIKTEISTVLIDRVALPIISSIKAILDWLGIAIQENPEPGTEDWIADVEKAAKARRPQRLR